MNIFSLLIILFWFIFLFYWFISSLHVKKNRNKYFFPGWIGLRTLVVIILLIIFHSQIARGLQNFHMIPLHNYIGGIIGVLLCGCGIGFAIWARKHLGKNWGMPMTQKEKPELITSGPYSYVRHPIYTGVLIAILGSVFVSGTEWFVVFILAGIYFIYSAKTEEKNLQKEFPETYPTYIKRTKLIIPFIF